ncbi:MAG: arylsulfatase [Planctomycetota bacterium]|jgi:arylsulfatase A-like enzyme
MNPRVICRLAAILALASATTFPATRAPAAPPARPNFIYILADDAGYGDLGCYGQRIIPTPNLDRMAAEGMRFTQHYAGSTVCAPSRCVLLTGRHTGHCRVRGNSPGLMLPDDVTVAELLDEAGYRTGCIGKWGVGNPPPLDDPNQNGFDAFYGYVSMWHAHNFYPEFLIRDGGKVALRNEVGPKWKETDGRGIAIKKVDYVPDLLTQEVLEFIQRNRSRPFFLYYALNVPHANNEATRADTPERGMEVPGFGPFGAKDWPGPEKGFAAMIGNIDRDVGRILDKLEDLGLDEKTLVIFTSDNGPHQEGGHRMDFFDSNGPLRGMKRDLYEGGVRVPMIARWPGRIEAGGTTDHVSAFQDVLPTLTELAGVAPPAEADGISMAATMLGNPDQQKRHEYLYWEFTEQGGKRALRQGPWKIVQLKVSSPTPADPELYHLDDDLGETKNVAAEHPEIVSRLIALMDEAHRRSESYPLLATERSAGKGKAGTD